MLHWRSDEPFAQSDPFVACAIAPMWSAADNCRKLLQSSEGQLVIAAFHSGQVFRIRVGHCGAQDIG
jgi:hypothetical protein